MRSAIFQLLLLWLLGLVQALSSSGGRLLVVTEDAATDKAKYSKFWSDLEARGFSLTFSAPKSDPPLFEHGERTQDHLLILPTKLKALGPALTPQILLDFAKEAGNILLALSANTPTPTSLQSLLLELDIHLPADRNTVVVDHFNYDVNSAQEKHDVLVVPPPTMKRKDIKNYFGTEAGVEDILALPRAVGQTLGNGSPLLSSILAARNTAYSYNPKESTDDGEETTDSATGSQISLVSAMQARNSARLTVLGSAEMLENTWFDAAVQVQGISGKSKTGNRAFAKRLTEWTFKEVGVLRVEKLQHYLSGGEQAPQGYGKNETALAGLEVNPKIYRIKNEATYTLALSEYYHNHWTPFNPPSNDAIQLEFTMLSPYHRLPLEPLPASKQLSKISTTFQRTFRLPDQHGIFNFRVNYKRPFLTNIDEKRTVTVRHYAHDEWPRSYAISGAYVWIMGIGVTVVGWLGFVGVWLWSAPSGEEEKRKKMQ